MAKKYQLEIYAPIGWLKKWRRVFDPFGDKEKPTFDRFIEVFNRSQDKPWQARIVEVKKSSDEQASDEPRPPGRLIRFDDEPD